MCVCVDAARRRNSAPTTEKKGPAGRALRLQIRPAGSASLSGVLAGAAVGLRACSLAHGGRRRAAHAYSLACQHHFCGSVHFAARQHRFSSVRQTRPRHTVAGSHWCACVRAGLMYCVSVSSRLWLRLRMLSRFLIALGLLAAEAHSELRSDRMDKLVSALDSMHDSTRVHVPGHQPQFGLTLLQVPTLATSASPSSAPSVATP